MFLAGPGQSTWTGRVHSLPEDLQGDLLPFLKIKLQLYWSKSPILPEEHLGGGLKHIYFYPRRTDTSWLITNCSSNELQRPTRTSVVLKFTRFVPNVKTRILFGQMKWLIWYHLGLDLTLHMFYISFLVLSLHFVNWVCKFTRFDSFVLHDGFTRLCFSLDVQVFMKIPD